VSRETGGPVLIVGGTGFIGSHLADRLAAAGRSVLIASPGGSWRWGAPAAGIEFHRLDLTDPSSEKRLGELLAGAASVVNLSGALWRPRLPPDTYGRLHVEGTRRLLRVARERAAPERPLRLVQVSTTGVLGPTGAKPRDEESPPAPSTVYEATKLEGEAAALEARGHGLEVAVARPGLVYGPRDLHLLALFRSIAGGSFRLIAGGRARWQPIYVEDVARGLERMESAPQADGACFHLAGAEPVSVAGLAGRIAAHLGTRIRRPGLPRPAAMLAGGLLSALCRPLGLDPPLTPARVRTLTQDRLYDISRAAERLGFRPEVGLDEGLKRTVDWYLENGHLDGRTA